MQITKRNVELRVNDSLMRVYVASPKPAGLYPGILFYSDIYQLGEPMIRLVNYLAGHGYVVAAPEIFHRLEPVGSVIEPDDIGRMRGNDDAIRTLITDYDADCRAVVDFLSAESSVSPDKIGTLGFCIGGHLSFRAAFLSEIKAAACCYPTGIPSGKLGQGIADTIERVSEIKGSILMVFGTLDPHIPECDRQILINALENAKIAHKVVKSATGENPRGEFHVMYEAEHTFMRDDGYRYDSAATTSAWSEIIAFFTRLNAI